MGYWGYYVVGRSPRPLADCASLQAVRPELTLLEDRAADWQVWECPAAGEAAPRIGSMNRLARETCAPALFGYVLDSDCVVVEAAAPGSGAWTACLAPAAMAAHLGEDARVLEDYFLPPGDAARRAVAWAAEAGFTVPSAPLLEALTAVAEPSAETHFFRFLDLLGVVER
ncbi:MULTISPECIES: hypothetical protein [Streptomyces]|uniref:Uncharacterized protein n=1 Tax=Streptomyces albus (strain ATCC 21838 / DSM 41398 / FERM P-419 / JCM 4703 / NBRC 107858) TaxID=1081613 RepID=A0A0B5F4D0_STRA4|nr:hypothetical protein [Streptomyces sp. SCSIO ZS0520]AJE85162.1 hypothetical protein SLNWT_4786 [Streptomyces albus]AOU79468.1 hypothetical protein SLNHY_4777 [Streptomyces albus]AYN35194.1 hypothetical protein DUI70_4696 [Streptomyces albus]